MTNEQIEDIINYLNSNKSNLPNSVFEALKELYEKVDYERAKAEVLALDNVFIIDSIDENTLDFIFNNQELLVDKSISNSEFNQLATEHKMKRLSELLEIKNDILDTSFLNEQHPKDKGSNYPMNVPPILSTQEIQNKMISFPNDKKINPKHDSELESINAHIKSYHEQHKAKQLELLRAKKQSNEHIEHSVEWIDFSEIEKLTEEIATFGTPDKIAKVKKYIDKLQSTKPVLQFNEFSKFNSLNADCPNFKEVAKFYKGNFILNNSKYLFDKSYHAPTPILLLGEPGIGKTHFAKKLAKLLGTSFHFLDANSITASWVLTGSSGQWQNADAGSIFKYLLDSNTISPVVILDEIDKLSQGKNYDPFSVFHQMFEPENASHFKDEFLNVHFDASKIIYILTANNANNIPESLLSRMRVFDIQRPSLEEMRVIAQNIYVELVGHSPLLHNTLTDNVLDKLVSLPPRDIKKQITNAVFSQLAENQDFNQVLNLDIQNIEKNWGF